MVRSESVDDLLVVDGYIDIDDTPRDKDQETGYHTKLEERMTWCVCVCVEIDILMQIEHVNMISYVLAKHMEKVVWSSSTSQQKLMLSSF